MLCASLLSGRNDKTARHWSQAIVFFFLEKLVVQRMEPGYEKLVFHLKGKPSISNRLGKLQFSSLRQRITTSLRMMQRTCLQNASSRNNIIWSLVGCRSHILLRNTCLGRLSHQFDLGIPIKNTWSSYFLTSVGGLWLTFFCCNGCNHDYYSKLHLTTLWESVWLYSVVPYWHDAKSDTVTHTQMRDWWKKTRWSFQHLMLLQLNARASKEVFKL